MGSWQFNAVAIIYFTAAGISFMLAYFGLKMRAVRGAALFSIIMSCVSLWIVAYTLGIYNSDYEVKLLFLRLEYIGIAGGVYVWVLFIAKYTQVDKWLNTWEGIALAIVPIGFVISALQIPGNGYIHNSFDLIEVRGLVVFQRDYAWGFYIWAGYAYTMMTMGVVVLAIKLMQGSGSAKTQLSILLPLLFVLMICSIASIANVSCLAPYELTPLAFVLVGIVLLISIYFYKFLNVVPVAHNLILKNVKAGVLLVDSRAHIIEINRVVERIIARSENSILGQHVEKFFPELSEILGQNSEQTDKKLEIELGIDKGTYEVIHHPLSDNSGNVFGQVIMMWDVTDQKMAINELDAYARTVAHELKTPLSHIMGFAKLIDVGHSEDKEFNDNIRYIISSGEKMKNIVDGLLMLAKIRNQEKIAVEQMDVHEIITGVNQKLTSYFNKCNVELILPKQWHSAIGHSLWVEEVWVNLITNAVKYGGCSPIVELGSELCEDGYVKYWVKDNGLGLTPEEQEFLFVEFSRLHPRMEAIKGHGLGLSIVKRIVKKLGGEVGVESVLDVGSTFYFKLPKV